MTARPTTGFRTAKVRLTACAKATAVRRSFMRRRKPDPTRGFETSSNEAMHGLAAPPIPKALYNDFASLYYARGQIRQALEMCERAKDPMMDRLACQVTLRLPTATSEDLLEIQRNWAAK